MSKSPGKKVGDHVSLPHQIGWLVGFPKKLAPGLRKPQQNTCYTKEIQIGFFKNRRLAEKAFQVTNERPHWGLCSLGSNSVSENSGGSRGMAT